MSQPKLTRRLILERPVRIPDGAGGFREDWSALGVFWAEIQPKNAREPLSGLRSNARVTHKITFRSAAKNSPRRPTADQRLRTGNRIFAIHGVSEADDRDAYLTIWAEEGAFS